MHRCTGNNPGKKKVHFPMIIWLVTFFILVAYCLLLLAYKRWWIRIKDYEPTDNDSLAEELPFLSIIISARNEENNIANCIGSIINQSYPKNSFEIIIVDDHSTDNTVKVIESFKNENILIIDLSKFVTDKSFNSYKKKAIDTAIQFARGELIVTTDADCIVPHKWLETLATFYQKKKPVFVCMPVVFSTLSIDRGFFNKFFNAFQALDFMTLQGITGASLEKKLHGLCNGANLAYQKKVFLEVNGFEGIDKIASGDDMLLMHKIQQVHPQKVLYLKSRDVIVETQPSPDLKDFLNQRIRWASKADKYTDKKIISVLVLVYFFNAWIVILGVASFFSSDVLLLFLLSIILKTFVELLFLISVAKFFKKQQLLWWFVPAQPFHILYVLIAGWLGKFGSFQWKGRKVK